MRNDCFLSNMGALYGAAVPGLASVVVSVGASVEATLRKLGELVRGACRPLEVLLVPEDFSASLNGFVGEVEQQGIPVRLMEPGGDPAQLLLRGLQAARGELVIWVDTERVPGPRQLNQALGLLARHPHWDALLLAPARPVIERRLAAAEGQPPWPAHATFVYRNRALGLLLTGGFPRVSIMAVRCQLWNRARLLMNAVVRFSEPHSRYRGSRREPLAVNDGPDNHEDRNGGRCRCRCRIMNDFLRDFAMVPLTWRIESSCGQGRLLAQSLGKRIRLAGHRLLSRVRSAGESSPWPPVAEVWIHDGDRSVDFPSSVGDRLSCRVLVAIGGIPPRIVPGWDLCLAFADKDAFLNLSGDSERWFATWDLDTLFTAIDIRTRILGLARLERAIVAGEDGNDIEATAVICTHRKIPTLCDSILSVCRQSMDQHRFEIVVVNNSPDDGDLEAELQRIHGLCVARGLKKFKVIDAPLPGLSQARNAAVFQARGAVLLFLDDDAVAPVDWVEQLVCLFQRHPRLGVVGGAIRLRPPHPRPAVLHPGWQRYWSHFIPDHKGYREVEKWWQFPWGANWAARRRVLLEMGGFRSRYGRVGDDFSGGEEIIAARLVQELGYAVGVTGDVEVEHRVARCRFTYRHVRRTILAGELVNYQAYRDGHFPGRMSLGATLKKLFRLRERGVRAGSPVAATVLHWLFWKEAWGRVLYRQLRDRLERNKIE